MLDQIGAVDQEYAHRADVELDPVERQLRQQCDQRVLALADLHDQHAVLGQVVGRLGKDAHREIQAVLAGGEAQFGLVRILGRQLGELLARHVRRVADDQVVALAGDAREQIRLQGAHARPDVVERDVLAGQRERVAADVDQVDRPVRMVHRHRDADAARAGAQIERAPDLAVVEPRRETAADHLGDRRARHQRARIGLELQIGEPGLAGQIRDRGAFDDAPLDQREHVAALLGGQPGLAVGRRQVRRQVQHVQHQVRGLVQRIVVTVAEGQSGGAEAAGPVADEIDDRREVGGHGRKLCDGRSHSIGGRPPL